MTDTHEWGTGFTVGPRIMFGDRFQFGFTYMKYQIPGGQTIGQIGKFAGDLRHYFGRQSLAVMKMLSKTS